MSLMLTGSFLETLDNPYAATADRGAWGWEERAHLLIPSTC